MRTAKFLILISIVLSLSACSSLNDGKISQDLLPWNESGAILLEDDFSDESSGWEVVNNIYELKGYSTSGYMISVNLPDSRSVSTTGVSFTDSITDIEVQKITGSRESQFGLICRFSDKFNFYAFVISSDGYAGIVRHIDGQTVLLGSEQYIRAEVINLEDGINTLTASCIGENLRLIVNDEVVVQAEDSTFSNGQNGIFVETYQEKASTVVFNDLIILKP